MASLSGLISGRAQKRAAEAQERLTNQQIKASELKLQDEDQDRASKSLIQLLKNAETNEVAGNLLFTPRGADLVFRATGGLSLDDVLAASPDLTATPAGPQGFSGAGGEQDALLQAIQAIAGGAGDFLMSQVGTQGAQTLVDEPLNRSEAAAAFVPGVTGAGAVTIGRGIEEVAQRPGGLEAIGAQATGIDASPSAVAQIESTEGMAARALTSRELIADVRAGLTREEIGAKATAAIEKEASEKGIPTAGRSILQIRDEIDVTRVADRETFILESEAKGDALDALISVREAVAMKLQKAFGSLGLDIKVNQIVSLMQRESKLIEDELPRSALLSITPTTDPLEIQKYLETQVDAEGNIPTSLQALAEERTERRLQKGMEFIREFGTGLTGLGGLGDLGGEAEVPVASEEGEPLPRF